MKHIKKYGQLDEKSNKPKPGKKVNEGFTFNSLVVLLADAEFKDSEGKTVKIKAGTKLNLEDGVYTNYSSSKLSDEYTPVGKIKTKKVEIDANIKIFAEDDIVELVPALNKITSKKGIYLYVDKDSYDPVVVIVSDKKLTNDQISDLGLYE